MKEVIVKTCKRCRVNYPLSQFRKYKNSDDGHYYYCKKCEKEYKHKWYRTNADRVKDKNKEWAKNNRSKMQKLLERGRDRNRSKQYYKQWHMQYFLERGMNLLNEWFPDCKVVRVGEKNAVVIPDWAFEMCYDGDGKRLLQNLLDYYGSLENMIKNKPESKDDKKPKLGWRELLYSIK